MPPFSQVALQLARARATIESLANDLLFHLGFNTWGSLHEKIVFLMDQLRAVKRVNELPSVYATRWNPWRFYEGPIGPEMSQTCRNTRLQREECLAMDLADIERWERVFYEMGGTLLKTPLELPAVNWQYSDRTTVAIEPMRREMIKAVKGEDGPEWKFFLASLGD